MLVLQFTFTQQNLSAWKLAMTPGCDPYDASAWPMRCSLLINVAPPLSRTSVWLGRRHLRGRRTCAQRVIILWSWDRKWVLRHPLFPFCLLVSNSINRFLVLHTSSELEPSSLHVDAGCLGRPGQGNQQLAVSPLIRNKWLGLDKKYHLKLPFVLSLPNSAGTHAYN